MLAVAVGRLKVMVPAAAVMPQSFPMAVVEEAKVMVVAVVVLVVVVIVVATLSRSFAGQSSLANVV